MKYSDQQRIQKIFEKSMELYEYIVGHQIKKEELLTETPLQWLVTTPLYNIGEHVYNLSSEYKEVHSEIVTVQPYGTAKSKLRPYAILRGL